MHPPVRTTDPSLVLEKLLKIGFGLGGLLSLALGVWMMLRPRNWYDVFPGQIADFGAFNAHFIKDMGGWWTAGGILLLFAFTNPSRFGGVSLIVSITAYASSAMTHITDIVAGRVGGEHWIVDAPTVFAPLLILVVMLWIWWSLQSERIVMDEDEEFGEYDHADAAGEYEVDDGVATVRREQPVLFDE